MADTLTNDVASMSIRASYMARLEASFDDKRKKVVALLEEVEKVLGDTSDYQVFIPEAERSNTPNMELPVVIHQTRSYGASTHDSTRLLLDKIMSMVENNPGITSSELHKRLGNTKVAYSSGEYQRINNAINRLISLKFLRKNYDRTLHLVNVK